MDIATKRKRITREILASSDFTKVCNQLHKNIDRAIISIRKDQKELFPEPYKDWRTNEIIE